MSSNKEFKYRGIPFFINDKCSGLTCTTLTYFSRCFTDAELALASPGNREDIRVMVIKKAIDRMLDGKPEYTGDVRERLQKKRFNVDAVDSIAKRVIKYHLTTDEMIELVTELLDNKYEYENINITSY